MAKIINKKSDIPKYAQKAIKNFKKLTKNQAIYEYEMLKLKRRAGKEFGAFLSGYLSRPEKVTKKAIEALKSLKGSKLQKEKYSYETEQRINRQARQYEYYFDLEEEAQQEIEYSEIAIEEELADDFISNLYQVIYDAQSQAIVSNSYYRSGRTKSSKSRQWLQDNIQRGTDLLIKAIHERTATQEQKIQFYKELAQYSLSDLQDAVSEYLAGLYRVTADNVSGYLQISRVYQIISATPISIDDAEEFDEL